MSCTSQPGVDRRRSDLVGVRWTTLVLWGIPALLVGVGLAVPAVRVWLWIPSFGVAGAACLTNAARCGRLHCFVTGPLFLSAAIVTGLAAAGVVAIGTLWVLGATIVGTAMGYAAEWIRGAYVENACAHEGRGRHAP